MNDRVKIVALDETASTSSALAAMASDCAHGTVVCARSQTAGRGQRGNSWEAAPGMNITMSVLLRPVGLAPAGQFVISQAVSMAIVDVLRRHLPDAPVSVKWPNDIYVGNGKICGILIENVINASSIVRSIAGVGINVNQTEFLSDAPNPVSMAGVSGRRFDVDSLVREFSEAIVYGFNEVCGSNDLADEDVERRRSCIAERYFASLWRRDGYYPYIDNIRGERIAARIASVAADGIITMRLRSADGGDGGERSYAFKEISAVLDAGFNSCV